MQSGMGSLSILEASLNIALFPSDPRFDSGNGGPESGAQQHSDSYIMESGAECDSDRNPDAHPFCLVHASELQNDLSIQ
jgi:hypothetical protein